MSDKMYLHPVPERIWHWIHALLILLLILSGIQIHWADSINIFGGFSHAVAVHNWAGILLVADFLFWLLYNLISRRITHYILKKEEIHPGLIVQARYYLFDIFLNRPHPYSASEDNKFNPLQKLVYLVTMFLLMPLLLISGIVFLYPMSFSSLITAIGGLKVVCIMHFIMGTVFASFFVVHIYLATTGHTVLTDFKSMITGYMPKEDH